MRPLLAFRFNEGHRSVLATPNRRPMADVAAADSEPHDLRVKLVETGGWIENLLPKHAEIAFVNLGVDSQGEERQIDKASYLSCRKAAEHGQSDRRGHCSLATQVLSNPMQRQGGAVVQRWHDHLP